MISRNTLLSAVGAWTISILTCSGMVQAQTVRPQMPGLSSAKVVTPGMAGNSNLLQATPQLSVAQLTATSGSTIDLQASFTHGGPVNGASLQFQVDGASVGQGVTGPDGNATVPYKLADSYTPSEHTIHVTFKGDAKLPPSHATGKLVVLAKKLGKLGGLP